MACLSHYRVTHTFLWTDKKQFLPFFHTLHDLILFAFSTLLILPKSLYSKIDEKQGTVKSPYSSHLVIVSSQSLQMLINFYASLYSVHVSFFQYYKAYAAFMLASSYHATLSQWRFLN